MCSMIMKETVSHYINNNSTVHCVFLDATKAFDRVEYCKLFKLFRRTGYASSCYSSSSQFVYWTSSESYVERYFLSEI
jgi:hypothetical protein